VALVLWLWAKGGMKGRLLVAAILINVAVTDQLSSHVIKRLVERPRPCQTLSDVRSPDGCGPASSFPSSHATNIGGVMTLVSLAYPAWTPLAAVTALLVGLSRVYLGVHYPSDVLAGFLIGFLCALAVRRLVDRMAWRFLPTVRVAAEKPGNQKRISPGSGRRKESHVRR
jgi:undecaprenyl-diphosphatase